MSGECTVTPGKVWSSDPITDEELNAAATPVVRVDEDSIGERELNIPAVASLIIGGTTLDNWCRNPGFTVPQTGQEASLSAGARRNTAAAAWYHGATGVSPVSTIDPVTPVTGAREGLTLTAAATGNCTAWIGQSFGKEEGQALYNRTVTIEVDVYNDALQTLTPRCRIRTWGTANDASTGTQVYDEVPTGGTTTVNQGATTRLAWTVTMSGTVDPSKGFDVEFYVSMSSAVSYRVVGFRRAALTVSAGAVNYSAATPRQLHRLTVGNAPSVFDDILQGWMPGDMRRVGLTSAWVCLDNATGAAVWREFTGIRRLINQWQASTTTSQQTTTVMPLDNTIPQITEGAQVLTLTVTPAATTNWLEIHVSGMVDLSTAGYVNVAVFRDSGADAIYATAVHCDTAARPRSMSATFQVQVPSTSAQTYTVRVGPTTGTASWLRTNGGDVFGGVCRGSITIKEWTPTA